jgi:hypothetical protein
MRDVVAWAEDDKRLLRATYFKLLEQPPPGAFVAGGDVKNADLRKYATMASILVSGFRGGFDGEKEKYYLSEDYLCLKLIDKFAYFPRPCSSFNGKSMPETTSAHILTENIAETVRSPDFKYAAKSVELSDEDKYWLDELLKLDAHLNEEDEKTENRSAQ